MSDHLKCVIKRTGEGVHLVLAKEGLVAAVSLDNQSALDIANALAKAVVGNEMERRMSADGLSADDLLRLDDLVDGDDEDDDGSNN